MDYIDEYGIYFLAVVVLLYHIKYPCNMRLYYGLVSFGVCMIVFKKFEEALLVGLFVALSSDLYKKYLRETFEGFIEGEESQEAKEGNKDAKKEDDDDDDDDDGDGFTEDLEEQGFDNYINLQETYKQNVENLDSATLEKMTSQTEKFMEQQKDLMKVVEKLGPTLKEGMSMLKTFSNLKDSVKSS